MIVEGILGLTMGLAPALFEEISYDESGNVQAELHRLPPADGGRDAQMGDRQYGDAVAASSARSQGHGESATGRARRHRQRRRGRAWHLGVRHVDIPITPAKV
jgi:carbon-monoxide dehydrogenase large subunit